MHSWNTYGGFKIKHNDIYLNKFFPFLLLPSEKNNFWIGTYISTAPQLIYFSVDTDFKYEPV